MGAFARRLRGKLLGYKVLMSDILTLGFFAEAVTKLAFEYSRGVNGGGKHREVYF
jgi:hypothetical protein